MPRVTTCESAESAAPNLGAMWFNQSLNLGGTTDYCSTGECFFKTGIRAFFTLEYIGCGEGLMFALFNGTLNNIATVGGDSTLPELLGYAGTVGWTIPARPFSTLPVKRDSTAQNRTGV